MFTKQVGQLDKLAEAGTDPRLIEVLRGILGNCQQALDHRGQVTISGTRPDGATDAMLTINEYGNSMAANFNKAQQAFPLADQDVPPVANQNVNGAMALHVRNGMARFGDLVRFDMLWAVAQDNWINVSGDDSYVDCYLASGRDGTQVQRTKPDGTLSDANIPLRIYLPRGGSGEDPNVRTGNLVGYLIGPDGEAVAITPYLDGTINKTIELWIGDSDDLSTDRPGWSLETGANGRYLRGATLDPAGDTDDTRRFTVAEGSIGTGTGEFSITTALEGGNLRPEPDAYQTWIIKRTS